jgi:hypothetical protein
MPMPLCVEPDAGFSRRPCAEALLEGDTARRRKKKKRISGMIRSFLDNQ